MAQAQGQRIYTINAQNVATALPALPIGGTVGQEVRAAVHAGKEVTIHESPITAHGWTGYGYTIIDPDTGAGAYLIEGRGNGAILFAIGIFLIGMVLALSPIIIASGGLAIAGIAPLLLLGIGALLMGAAMLGLIDNSFCKVGLGLIIGTALASVSSIILIPAVGAASASALAGLLNLILGSHAMRGYGAAYAWFVGDSLCKP